MKTLTFLFLACLMGLPCILQAQTTPLPTFIEKDMVLKKGLYVVEHNTKIGENATLKVKYGTKILFNRGASIKVEGGLIIEGTPKILVELTSASPLDEGMGFIITGANDQKEIDISFADFHHLLIPLNFETNWYRKNVNINNCIFTDIETGEPGIIIRHPDEIKYRDSTNLIFRKNNFIGNSSIIYIENTESDVLNMAFEYNVVSGNHFHGFDIGGSLNSPLLLLYDQRGLKYRVKFTGNSIYNNYLTNNENDTIIHESNMAIKGKGEKFDVSGNYYGNRDERAIIKTFNHFTRDASLPYLDPAPQLQFPSTASHGHLWKIFINDNEIMDWNLPDITRDTIIIKAIANRHLWIRQGVDHVTYHYYEPNTNMVFDKLLSPLNTGAETTSNTFEFIFSDEIFTKYKQGYFSISGILDYDGFPAPRVTIGKNQFVKFLSENKNR